jgi:hypothetical protein
MKNAVFWDVEPCRSCVNTKTIRRHSPENDILFDNLVLPSLRKDHMLFVMKNTVNGILPGILRFPPAKHNSTNPLQPMRCAACSTNQQRYDNRSSHVTSSFLAEPDLEQC